MLASVIDAATAATWQFRPSLSHYDPLTQSRVQGVDPPGGVSVDPAARTSSPMDLVAADAWKADRSDLAAQWTMADIAFVGVVVGSTGLFFVAWTLLATQDAARSARDTLDLAQRTFALSQTVTRAESQPYLATRSLEIVNGRQAAFETNGMVIPTECLVRAHEGVYLELALDIENGGRMPAFLRSLTFDSMQVDLGGYGLGALAVRPTRSKFDEAILPGATSRIRPGFQVRVPATDTRRLFPVRDIVIRATCRLRYTDDLCGRYEVRELELEIATVAAQKSGGELLPVRASRIRTITP